MFVEPAPSPFSISHGVWGISEDNSICSVAMFRYNLHTVAVDYFYGLFQFSQRANSSRKGLRIPAGSNASAIFAILHETSAFREYPTTVGPILEYRLKSLIDRVFWGDA